MASLFGAYYVGAALDDCEGRRPTRFYQTTILGRALLTVAFVWLVAAKQSEPGLLLLAAANALSAWALHSKMA